LSLLAGQILNGIATGMLLCPDGARPVADHRDPQHSELRHGALFAVGAYLLATAVNVLGNFWIGSWWPARRALLGVAIEYAASAAFTPPGTTTSSCSPSAFR